MPTTSSLRIHADRPAIVFDVPAGTDLLTVPRSAPPLASPTNAIAQALLEHRSSNRSERLYGPTPSPSMGEGRGGGLAPVVSAASPEKAPAHKTAVIGVSDITRPDVPSTGPASILHLVLRTLEAQGLLPEHMTILVATGTHRASTQAEKMTLCGADVVHRYAIVDHSATDTAWHQRLGRMPRLGVIRDGAHVMPRLIGQ
jgi:hypothetical protein